MPSRDLDTSFAKILFSISSRLNPISLLRDEPKIEIIASLTSVTMPLLS